MDSSGDANDMRTDASKGGTEPARPASPDVNERGEERRPRTTGPIRILN